MREIPNIAALVRALEKARVAANAQGYAYTVRWDMDSTPDEVTRAVEAAVKANREWKEAEEALTAAPGAAVEKVAEAIKAADHATDYETTSADEQYAAMGDAALRALGWEGDE